jgi:hypothetical protein
LQENKLKKLKKILDILENICYNLDSKTAVYNFFSFSVVVVVKIKNCIPFVLSRG